MSITQTVAVVGASLAGVRCVEGLRRRGFDGNITLIGAETRLAYDRPPLSKQLLAGEWEPDRIALEKPEFYEGLDLRLGVRATSLDVSARTISLDDGSTLSPAAVVVATGATPRRLPGEIPASGVHVLRTLEDALALRDAFAAGPGVVVVGAGFIGSEVAATARGHGLEVTVVEALPAPLSLSLGARMGEALAALHRAHGVEVRCGVGVEAIEGGGSVEAVRLADGTRLPADVVVVGIGVVPETAWLDGSGLEIDNGVVCDAFCRVRGGDGWVWACGDVARWPHAGFDEVMRVEHWTNATDMADALAGNLLNGADGLVPFEPMLYVWSDQYAAKIQILGRVGPDDDVEILHGSADEMRFVAAYLRDGHLRGVVGFTMPRMVNKYAALIREHASIEEVRVKAADLES